MLPDAAGAERAESGKGLGYCYDWTKTKFMFAWSTDCTTLSFLRKTLCTFDFQI